MKLAFVGIGVMGGPMAAHLARAGHDMVVYNRTASKAQRWSAEHGGRAAASVAQAAEDREAIILCVGDDSDVRGAVTAALPALAAGAVIVDHTTTSARLAREMSASAVARGCAFLDAPVSGGETGARMGTLSVMAGGDAGAFARMAPVLAAYARSCRLMGPSGDGQLTKMVNQICIAGIVQGLAEAVAFGRLAGLDLDLAYQAVSKGAAQSWQMDNRWRSMTQGRFDFGFAVDWMRKDLGLVLDQARASGARVEVTALIDQFYAEVQAMGGRRWDTSSLAARLMPRRPET
ncbi:MAG TPA: NAD(P)-dependent oxidoreductase [Caulobacteraceae bacterium]